MGMAQQVPGGVAAHNREVIDETGHGEDMVCFARSGYTQSPGISPLFWLGDQMMSWDEYDGIKTAVVGILSGGMSGFSLMHSDIGGYVNLKIDIDGQNHPGHQPHAELLMRWMELNAFTAVMRTQEGIVPGNRGPGRQQSGDAGTSSPLWTDFSSAYSLSQVTRG